MVVEGSRSRYENVRSGVPQGSVLRPCLFLAYINDLPDRVSSNTRLFADDTAVDRVIITETDQGDLQKDIDALAKWEDEWDMSFHPDKCTVLTVSRNKNPKKAEYKLHGQTLKEVQEAKYLGVTLQNNGEWTSQINQVTAKANQTLGFLRRNLKISSKNHFKS